MSSVLCDFRSNAGRPLVQLCLFLFRFAQLARRKFGKFHPAALLTSALYRSTALFLLGLDLPTSTSVGPGLRIFHGMGIVISARCRIGADVTLRQFTTLGERVEGGAAPTVGASVEFGVGVTVLGGVQIGRGSVIGAETLLLEDVAPQSVVIQKRLTEIRSRPK